MKVLAYRKFRYRECQFKSDLKENICQQALE